MTGPLEDVRRHNKVMARIEKLDPLLKDNCGWISLWKAGFWQYFIEYRVKSLFGRSDWRRQCKHEALAEILSILNDESTDLQDTAARLKAVLDRSNSEITKMATIIQNTNRHIAANKTLINKVANISGPYDELVQQEEDDSLQATNNGKHPAWTENAAAGPTPPSPPTSASFYDRCVVALTPCKRATP